MDKDEKRALTSLCARQVLLVPQRYGILTTPRVVANGVEDVTTHLLAGRSIGSVVIVSKCGLRPRGCARLIVRRGRAVAIPPIFGTIMCRMLECLVCLAFERLHYTSIYSVHVMLPRVNPQLASHNLHVDTLFVPTECQWLTCKHKTYAHRQVVVISITLGAKFESATWALSTE